MRAKTVEEIRKTNFAKKYENLSVTQVSHLANAKQYISATLKELGKYEAENSNRLSQYQHAPSAIGLMATAFGLMEDFEFMFKPALEEREVTSDGLLQRD